MAVSPSLSDSIGDKFATLQASNPEAFKQDDGTPFAAPPSQDGGQAAKGADGDGEAKEGQKPDGAKPEGDKPNIEELGFEGADPAAKGDDKGGEPAEPETAKLELAIDPTLVVGKLGDKEITAAELQNAVAAHADVTRTRTQFADYKKNAEPVLEYIQANMEPLKVLDEASVFAEAGKTEEAQAALVKCFEIVAKQLNVEFKAPSGAQRDDKGRFVSGAKDDDLEAHLAEIEEEHGKDSNAYRLAKRQVDLDKRLAAQEQSQRDSEARLASAQEAAKARDEVTQWATKWKDQGIEGVNVEAAMNLVGKPMTAAQALQLSNMRPFLTWYAGNAPGSPDRPNTPPNSGSNPPLDKEKAGLGDIISEKLGKIARK